MLREAKPHRQSCPPSLGYVLSHDLSVLRHIADWVLIRLPLRQVRKAYEEICGAPPPQRLPIHVPAALQHPH